MRKGSVFCFLTGDKEKLMGAALFCAGLAAAQSVGDFQLPPKSLFSPAMPRYPNAWFYVDASIVASHQEAVKLITSRLRNSMRLPEYFPPFSNPEGCDYEVRIEHLQPWIDPARPRLQHAHAFHLRYYYTALTPPGPGKVRIPWRGTQRDFYRFAASVHYEVEHANPHHADVEQCPICGRTGDYAALKGNLVEQAHDPLGLELLFTGKIRGEAVHMEDWERRPVGSVMNLKDRLRVSTFVFPGQTEDRNTLRIGIAVFEPKQ
jgi:hypothetical protein